MVCISSYPNHHIVQSRLSANNMMIGIMIVAVLIYLQLEYLNSNLQVESLVVKVSYMIRHVLNVLYMLYEVCGNTSK